MELIPKDIEKLKQILDFIQKGTATTYDKPFCIEGISSVLEPKCCICRKIIEKDMVIINDRKMHSKCEKKYKPK